jgi:hypothetical protein
VKPSQVAHATYRVACASLTVCILGLVLDEVFWKTTLHGVLWGHFVSVSALVVILGVLLALRSRPTELLGSAALLLCVVATLAALSLSDRRLAASNVRWTPFEPQRLGALAIALLAPPRAWLGAICIAAATVVPLVEWATWSANWRAGLPASAPWMVVAYGLFAVVIYAHQLARQALATRVAVAWVEAIALEQLARLVLTVRDLANTPLQTIELTVALIRKQKTFEPSLLARLERAAQRLVAIAHAVETEQLVPAEAAPTKPSRSRRARTHRAAGLSSSGHPPK